MSESDTYHLSLRERQRIIRLYESNHTKAEIARLLECSWNTVNNIIKQYEEDQSVQRKPRSGRPRSTSPTTDRRIVRLAATLPAGTTRSIAQLVTTTEDAHPSHVTVLRRLHDAGMVYRLEKRVPLLNDSQKEERLLYAHTNKNRNWNNVLFADETTLFLGSPTPRSWQFIDEPIHHPTIKFPPKVNVFSCICSNGVGDIYLFQDNLTAEMLCDIMQREVVSSAARLFGRGNHNWLLQHDKDPKYTSHLCRDKCEQLHIERLYQPPQSPDLNPIENVWTVLKNNVAHCHPTDVDSLMKAIENEWKKIDEKTILGHIRSMPKRCQAVIDAHGGNSDY
jgi:transposase